MDYSSIFDPVPWPAVISSAAQAVVIYWVTILCIKLIGIHITGQSGPQYLAFLLLFTTGMSSGLTNQQAGFWGSIATALSLTATIMIVSRIPGLGKWIHGTPVTLFEKGKMDHSSLKRTLVDQQELDKVAHEYGLPSHEAFERVILENDGRLTAVLKQEYRMNKHKLN